MIRTYSELSERQKEQVAAQFSEISYTHADYAYELTPDGKILSRSRYTKINIFGQLKDNSLGLLLQDIPVKANEAGAEGTRIALSMRSDPQVVEAWWDFAGNGYAPQERGVDRFTERDEAPLVKPEPKGVKAGPMDV